MFPFQYDHAEALVFGGALPDPPRRSTRPASSSFPCPVDRTTSYVGGTRNGPHEILQASSHMELWDDEMKRRRPRRRHLHAAGDGAALRRDGAARRRDRARRLRGDRRATSSWSRSAASTRSRRRWSPPRRASIPGCRCCRSTRTPTCATPTWGRCTTTPARCAASLQYARMTQVGIRSLSTEEAEVLPKLNTHGLLRRRRCAQDPKWIDAVVESLGRERLRDHRRGRHGPGDHAGDRHARARRPVVAGDHPPARAPPPNAGASSPPTSSS